MSDDQSAAKEGVFIGLLAYVMWGLMPIYFKIISSVGTTEILAHRIIWAVPFGALIIVFRRQWGEVRRVFLHKANLSWLVLAAICIGFNWLIYVWAVQNEKIFEASLGYYINPLMYVMVGVFFFHEKLRRLQFFAVALAVSGVVILTISGDEVPWVSLSLAVLFTMYGVIRKRVPIGAMPGLFVETILLFPLAMAWLIWLMFNGQATFGQTDLEMTSLIILAGPITVLPLLFFAVAARRLPLSTIGFMQFLAPTLQLGAAVYYGEQVTTPLMICFGLIWLAVVFFVYDAFKNSRSGP